MKPDAPHSFVPRNPTENVMTELKPGESRQYQHPEAGSFLVRRSFGPHPDGLPYFTDGRFYASEQAAVDGFFAACAADAPTDEDLALMDRGAAESRVADRIDGYDRDDLGESPDY